MINMIFFQIYLDCQLEAKHIHNNIMPQIERLNFRSNYIWRIMTPVHLQIKALFDFQFHFDHVIKTLHMIH